MPVVDLVFEDVNALYKKSAGVVNNLPEFSSLSAYTSTLHSH